MDNETGTTRADSTKLAKNRTCYSCKQVTTISTTALIKALPSTCKANMVFDKKKHCFSLKNVISKKTYKKRTSGALRCADVEHGLLKKDARGLKCVILL